MNFRKVAYELHLWLGLTSGLIVVIVALTGCILSFEKEIQLKMHPERYRIHPVQQQKLSLAVLKKKADEALPEKLRTNRVEFFADADRSYMFRALKINNEALTFWDSYEYYYRVYINPYTGTILEVQNAKIDFFEVVLNLHRRLWLGEKIGAFLTGYATVIFLVVLCSGLILWLPRKIKRNMFKGKFLVKKTDNLKRLNYDLHNVLGFYSLLPLLLICYTAIVWNFKEVDKFIEKTLNGKSYTAHERPVSIPKEGTDYDKVLTTIEEKVNRTLSGKKKALISFPKSENGTYYAEITYGSNNYQNDQFYFDQYSGAILKSESYKHTTIGSGTALRKKNYDLHTGTILGTLGQFLYLGAVLIGASLPITGFLIYLNKNKKRGKKKKLAKK